MAVIYIYIICIIGMFLDISLLPQLGTNFLLPVIGTTLIIIISARDHSYHSLFLALILGVIYDATSGSNLPIFLILYLVIFLFNKYLIADVLSYDQTKLSLFMLIGAVTAILLLSFKDIYTNLMISNTYILTIILNYLIIICVFLALKFLLAKPLDNFEKQLAERYR